VCKYPRDLLLFVVDASLTLGKTKERSLGRTKEKLLGRTKRGLLG
jgi:hypothetical protein